MGEKKTMKRRDDLSDSNDLNKTKELVSELCVRAQYLVGFASEGACESLLQALLLFLEELVDKEAKINALHFSTLSDLFALARDEVKSPVMTKKRRHAVEPPEWNPVEVTNICFDRHLL